MKLAPRSPSASRVITRTTPFDELPQFLTVEEFRAYLALGRSAMYELLHRNAIEHVRYGRLIRIPKTALLSSKDRTA